MSEFDRAKVLVKQLLEIEADHLCKLLDIVDRLNAISKKAYTRCQGGNIAENIADVGAELLKVATEK